MKIAQVVCTYPPYKGGIGNVAKTYTDGLRAVGEDVTVFFPDKKTWFRFGHAAFMPSLVWRLRGFDVIHLHYPFYGAAFFAAVASVLWSTPLILTYHMRTKASGWRGWFFALHRKCIEPMVLGDARVVLVSSQDYAQAMGLETSGLRVLPFGVNTSRFIPGEGLAFRKLWKVEPNVPVVLFVGGLDDAHYFKGLDVLLTALSRMPKDRMWKLVVVGEGNRKEVFQQMAVTLGIQERVVFAGRVSDEHLPGFYQAANMHVLPSVDRSEAFGLVTLEAAASALPSVVSDLPGVRTLVTSGVTGYHVVPGDAGSLRQALRVLMDDLKQCRAMGAEARMRAEQEFDEAHLLERLRELYKLVKVKAL